MGKNLIAVSSKIGGGKDTFFNILQKKTNNSYSNKKFAWKLKEIAEKLTGIPALDFEKESVKNSYLPEEWNYFDSNQVGQRLTCREFMQKLGTEGLRNGLHQNVWVNSLFADYKVAMSDGWVPTYNNPDNSNLEQPAEPTYPNWFISDCRFENEAAAIKKRDGAIIRINRYYTWEQFSKIYGISLNSDGELTKDDVEKKSALEWGYFLKNISTLNSTPELETAIKKIFHTSETSLDNYTEFDYVIENKGTVEDFENEIEKCMSFLGVGVKYENSL
jgi:hypothetical protein